MLGLVVACPSGQATRPPDTTAAPPSEPAGVAAPPVVERCPPGIAAEGCPPLDLDGDGIVDGDDRCPDNPETRNGYQDEDGCPDEIPATLTRYTGTIKGVVFGRASAAVTESQAVLDAAAAVLQEYPAIMLEISGHTAPGERPELSLRRAEAVRDYLVARGVDAARLRVRGAAEEEPIGDLATAAGKAKNRRVEFTILESE
jgi:OOP family OmpA-OmpF porin